MSRGDKSRSILGPLENSNIKRAYTCLRKKNRQKVENKVDLFSGILPSTFRNSLSFQKILCHKKEKTLLKQIQKLHTSKSLLCCYNRSPPLVEGNETWNRFHVLPRVLNRSLRRVELMSDVLPHHGEFNVINPRNHTTLLFR